jgi:hypothetical protein
MSAKVLEYSSLLAFQLLEIVQKLSFAGPVCSSARRKGRISIWSISMLELLNPR